MLFLCQISFGQNGVTITTPASNPTSQKPIPLNIQFEDAVNSLIASDFSLSNGSLNNLKREVPNFKYFPPDQTLRNFQVSKTLGEIIADIEYDFDELGSYLNGLLADAVVSIDFDGNNDLFYLTYRNGLFKQGQSSPVIGPDKFDTPLDFVINRNTGYVYVADHGKKQILVFNSSFSLVDVFGAGSSGEENDPRGTTGLALDSDGNIYDADNYTGNASGDLDAIKIYKPDGSLVKIIKEYNGDPIKDPFRIAVDKEGNIFLSDSGGDEGQGRILIYNSNYQPIKKIEVLEQGTPGSLVTDEYGYLYAVNFGEDFNLNDLFNDPLKVLTNYNNLKNSSYSINVFDPKDDYNFLKEIQSENINLPIDIALNNCGVLNLNDLDLGGEGVDIFEICPLGPFGDCYTIPRSIDATFDFKLKKFQRQDNFTADLVPLNEGLVNVNIENKNLFLCDPQPQGEFSIEYALEDMKPTFQNCSGDQSVSNDTGECGAIVTFPTPTASDENGTVEVKRTDDTGLNSGDLFPVGTTAIRFEATDDQENTSVCKFDVIVTDSEKPSVNCVGNYEISLKENEIYTLKASDLDAGSTDNCGITDISIDKTEFTADDEGTVPVKLTATDASGNSNTCTVNVKVTVQKRPFNCKTDASVTLQLDANGQGQLQLEDVIDITGDTSGYNFTWSQQDFNCNDLGKSQDITLSFTNGDDSGECVISVEVLDSTDPTISCPDDSTVSIAPGTSYTIPDFTGTVNADDNCAISKITQNPVAGTKVTADTTVKLIAEDASGNTSECSFTIAVNETEAPKIDCITNYNVAAGENCEYIVPDFSEILTYSPSEAEITQQPEAGSVIDPNSDPYITVTATYNGLKDVCNVYLVLKDETAPVVNCLQNQVVSIPENGSYTIPSYLSQISASDNCGNVNLEQNPSPGVEITSDTPITITATDDAGNSADCEFQLIVIVEKNLAINCPVDKEFSFDENCSFELPDFTAEAEVINGEGLTVFQSPAAGTIITDASTKIELSVEKEGERAACSFMLNLKDNTPPVVNCVGTFEIMFQRGETFTLDPQELDDGSYDNCSDQLSFSLSKSEFTSADEGAVTVIMTGTDEAGNSASCETTVNVVVENEGNPDFIARDDEYETSENSTLRVTSSGGILQNDSAPVMNDVSIILDTDVSHGSLDLNEDGSFDYTPETGFTGQDFFKYRITDGESTSGEATVIINVVPAEGEFSCLQHLVVEIGEEGSTIVPIENFYSGNADGLQFGSKQLTFTCNDIGENTVILSYTGRLNGSCEINVSVIDDTSPVLNVKDISIDLNLEGAATIGFEDIDNGSYDTCDEDVTYSLSKSTFSCPDVGENIVQVTAEDASGNITIAEVTVKVYAEEGICDKPTEGTDYIFIYPNPNSGEFSIATPGDVTISRIEVFDNRGRFITAKDYAPDAMVYDMNVGPLQEAIYVLKITTNEGAVTKRFILKN